MFRALQSCWILNAISCRTVVQCWTKEWNPLVGNQITRLAAPGSAYCPAPPCLTVGPTNRPASSHYMLYTALHTCVWQPICEMLLPVSSLLPQIRLTLLCLHWENYAELQWKRMHAKHTDMYWTLLGLTNSLNKRLCTGKNARLCQNSTLGSWVGMHCISLLSLVAVHIFR